MEVTLRGGQASDYPVVCGLLTEAGLPVDDLSPESMRWFVLAQAPAGGAIFAAGAAQPFGGDGLLRSVAVAPALRARGVGARIVHALEAKAASSGMAALYLLTADAAGFFEALGYRRIDRARVPAAVRSSAQFASICPASAVCMTRTLAPRRTG
jgi:amino-acid N-acetyltransferase